MQLCLKSLGALLPRVVQWANHEQRKIVAAGIPLCPERLALARLAGVKHPEKIRMVMVPFIAPPNDPELSVSALLAGLITPQTTGMVLGYAIALRLDIWSDPLRILEKFVHVNQHEKLGGLAAFLKQYLLEFSNHTLTLKKEAEKTAAILNLESFSRTSLDPHFTGNIQRRWLSELRECRSSQTPTCS
jgi:hypothetical protein